MNSKIFAFKHLFAIFGMLLGTFFLLLIAVFMNQKEQYEKDEKKVFATSIDVAPTQKPKPKPKPKQEPKPKPKSSPKMAPAANLGGALAGIDLGLPEFGIGEFEISDNMVGDVDKNLVMTASTVDEPPKPTSRVGIEYPKDAKNKGIKGYVVFNILIDKAGNVTEMQILESVPSGIFDQAASDSVSQWKFSPAKYKNEAVKVWAKQKIRFDLE
ncbi:MAG: TonB family protein [Campylobacterales bacterium]|nr:TonB family protein [Campylobacterales bacterium]